MRNWTEWNWTKSRKCEGKEMEECHFGYTHYYRVKSVPQYIFYLDQYESTGWHIQNMEMKDITTEHNKADCVYWALGHRNK